MKRILIIGGFAVLLAGGAALAQEGPRGGRMGDTDNDGRVSQAEFTAAALARFDAVDANRDGTVSTEERQAARDARRAQGREARFARLDANSDGAISRAEFDTVADQRGERGDRGPRGGRHGGRGEGRGHGRGPGAEDMTRSALETNVAERFTRMDANGDGYLSPEDRAARRGARGAAPTE